MQSTYTDNLTQSERLELCSGNVIIPPDSIGQDERRVLSVPPHGFKMPSMERVRLHDARLSAYGSNDNVLEDESDEESDEESELREHAYAKRTDSMREHSFRLPSMRSRRDVTDTLRSMGCSYAD